jgi:hypothetical protein
MIKNKKILAIVMLVTLPFYALGVDKVTYGPGAVPLGGIVMVMPTTLAAAWQPPVSGVIKDGFMRADGATVPSGQGSPMQGLTLPNMTGYFPKGAVTSGTATAYGVAFSGTAAARSGWFGTANLTATAPAHYHGMGAGADLNITASGSHSHLYTYSGLSTLGASGNTRNVVTSEPTYTTTSDTHIHASASFAGNIGLVSGGANGNTAMGISFPAANDSMGDWSAAGSYTPAGTMSGDPATITVVYVIRVK